MQRERLVTNLRPTFSGVGFLTLLELLIVLLVLLPGLLVARGLMPVVLLLVEAIVFVSVSPPVFVCMSGTNELLKWG